MTHEKTVVVAGDLIMDHHIYEGRRHHYSDGINPGVRIVRKPGGAALIHELLECMFGNSPETSPVANAETQTEEPKAPWQARLAVQLPSGTGDVEGLQHAYAFWRPFPSSASSDRQTWRVSEAMGFGDVSGHQTVPARKLLAAEGLPRESHVVVVSDGGMGFRENAVQWANLKLEAARWILLKTAAPLCRGRLWDELISQHGDRLIVLLSARELRKTAGRISEGLSWETTLKDVLRELTNNAALTSLRQCRHLLLTFESEGGVWIDLKPGGREPDVHFVYDAATIEGEHAYEVKGTAFGFLSCLAAAVAWHTTINDSQPDLEAALEGGLSAMRNLRDKGHGLVGDEPRGYPAARLAGVIKEPAHRFSRAAFPLSAPDSASSGSADWSLLMESQKTRESTTALARLVVLRGPIALENLPHLAIGKLITVDRSEIESLRTLSQLIRHYQDHDSGTKPLSIGVFGPPGAGKSFAVRELAGKLIGRSGWMEFNLSQFDTPADLIGAFHQIRDRALQGILPVAFFDEFDSQQYRWLQYLLAPMQDGRFQEGQLTHPLGKCIFIFAGATSWTFETFGPSSPKGEDQETDDFRQFRLLKGPDFKSRLDGYLDVVGPNRRKVSPPPETCLHDAIQVVSGHSFAEDSSDIYFPIRRALMMRGEFRCPSETRLEIDEGVIRALLKVEFFRYGSRSLNKILQPLKLALPDPLGRSLLPPKGLLAMHTNAELFLSLVDEPPPAASQSANLSDDQIERIAQEIHKKYDELGLRLGWSKKSTSFETLDEFKQGSNRAAARRMVGILQLVGLDLDPDGKKRSDPRQIRQHLEYHLELLADAEHEGWMQWHFDNDWQYGSRRDNAKRLHPSLVPYRELSDEDRNKDRNQIRHYHLFAEAAGMSIYFVDQALQ